MPEDLWEAPTVETEMLQRYCELITEEYEDEIERWFWQRIKHKTFKDPLSVSDFYLKKVFPLIFCLHLKNHFQTKFFF